MGWSGKRNGELLKLMLADGFEVFLTVDQNLKFQQNILASGIAVLVFIARSNRLVDLLPLIPNARQALGSIKAGDIVEVQ